MTNTETSRAILLNKLKSEQLERGCISDRYLFDLAKNIGISTSEAYGVATFYSFLTTEPQGKHVIRVCKSVPCCMKNAELIIDWIGAELKLQPGQTSRDGRFSFELANCIGACDMAPAILIDDQMYGHLTPEKISEILKSLD